MVAVIKTLFIIIYTLISPLLTSLILYFIYFRYIKKLKPIKKLSEDYKEKSIFHRLFIQFPERLIKDRLLSDPNVFPEFGLHVIEGEQGSGKTTTLAYLCRKYKKSYPKMLLKTNFDCKIQDEKLIDLINQLDLSNIHYYGEMDCIDELLVEFSNDLSRSFPSEVLQILIQERKCKRAIFTTTQTFSSSAIQLRRLTSYLYTPFTVLGCLTIVRRCKPRIDKDGNITDKKGAKFFFYVHDEQLRSLFDTRKIIKKSEGILKKVK